MRENDKALEYLQQAVKAQPALAETIRYAPEFERLHMDPKFKQIAGESA